MDDRRVQGDWKDEDHDGTFVLAQSSVKFTSASGEMCDWPPVYKLPEFLREGRQAQLDHG